MTGNVITVKGRLWAHLNLIAAGAMPLLLSRYPRAMGNEGESPRASVLMIRSPGLFLLLLFVLPSAEFQSLTVIPGHSGAVCLPKLSAVVSWEKDGSTNRKHFACLAFHIRKRDIYVESFLIRSCLINFVSLQRMASICFVLIIRKWVEIQVLMKATVIILSVFLCLIYKHQWKSANEVINHFQIKNITL